MAEHIRFTCLRVYTARQGWERNGKDTESFGKDPVVKAD